MSVTDAAGLKGRLRKKTAAPAFLVVNFRDTGGGIDPGIRKRIFEPYYTTRGNDGGLGLGLSVTYAIVSDLGGDIRVISRKGSGTSFRIYLPVSR
jgi:C4-dicarboxylate-specific signal transduction histidine kinase